MTVTPLMADREPSLEGPVGRAGVLRGGLWSAASQVLPAAGTAVLSVAAGRVLGSGPLGQQSLIAYANSAASSVLVISLNTALLQAGGRLQGARDSHRLRGLVRWAVGGHVAIGAVVLAIMAVTGEIMGHNRLAWAVVGVVSVLDAAADGLAIKLILVEGWAPIGRLRLIFQFLGPFLGVALLFAGQGIVGIFLGDGIAALGLLIAAAARFRRIDAADVGIAPPPGHRPRPGSGHRTRPLPHGNALRANAVRASGLRAPAPSRSLRPPVAVFRPFLLFATGALITQVVSKRVEFIVLAGYSGDVAVGMYSVAFVVVSLLSMIPNGIATAAMPLVAAAEGRGEVAAATRHLRFALRLGTAITLPATGLVGALGPAAIVFVYGSEYDRAAALVPYASAALLVAVVIGLCTQFWSGRGRLGIVLWSGSIAAVVDVGVALVFVPSFGDGGAVAANLSGQVALAAGLLYATVRQVGAIGWSARSLLAAVLAGAAGAGTVAVVFTLAHLLLGSGELGAGVTLVVGGPAGVAAVLLAAVAGKLFDPEEAEWLRPMMPGRAHRLLARMTRLP